MEGFWEDIETVVLIFGNLKTSKPSVFLFVKLIFGVQNLKNCVCLFFFKDEEEH